MHFSTTTFGDFPFHIPLIYALLPLLPFLFLPCPYDARHPGWNNAVSTYSGCGPGGIWPPKCLFVRNAAKESDFTDV